MKNVTKPRAIDSWTAMSASNTCGWLSAFNVLSYADRSDAKLTMTCASGCLLIASLMSL